jgi:hypothetical protein
MRTVATLLVVFLVHTIQQARADALYGASTIQEPYKFISANACTISYPGKLMWAANIAPSATSLSQTDQTRVVDLIDTATLNPSQVTDDMRAEFSGVLSKLQINARLLRNKRILGRCSFRPALETSSFREGADSSLPVIRIGSRPNCNLLKGARSNLRSGDTLSILQAREVLISATLRRCADGCGIVNCK